jgi:hypothetical protein
MFSMGAEAALLCREQRLAGLHRIIPLRRVKRAICQCGRRRLCLRCPAQFMVYFVLAMGLFCGDCYRQVFRWIGSRHKRSTPGRSTLCEARQRLGVKVLVILSRWTVQLLATSRTPSAFHRNLRLMAVDGFVADLPDSQANRLFGYPHARDVSPSADRRIVRSGHACVLALADQADHHVRSGDGQLAAQAASAGYVADVGSRLSLATDGCSASWINAPNCWGASKEACGLIRSSTCLTARIWPSFIAIARIANMIATASSCACCDIS